MQIDKTKFILTVEKVEGECSFYYREGDEVSFAGLQTPKNEFCGGSYYTMFPMILGLYLGTTFYFEQEKGTIHTVCHTDCPGQGKVFFKIVKKEE